MPDITSIHEVTRDQDGFRMRLPGLAVFGARYQELKKLGDQSFIQPGAADSWLDFCRQLKRVINEAKTWEEWDAKTRVLDETHPTKFTHLTRRLEGKRPLPSDPNAEGERLRAVMELRGQLGSSPSVEEVWKLVQEQRMQVPPRSATAGLDDYMRQAFEWAKSAGYARRMPLEEFEPGFQPTSAKAFPTGGDYRLWLEGDEESIVSLRWLIEHQAAVVKMLEPAMIKSFDWMREHEPWEEIWFPKGEAASLALDRFWLKAISIRQDRIILSFEVPFGHFMEHGCYSVIRDGVLEGFGAGDEVLDFDDCEWGLA